MNEDRLQVGKTRYTHYSIASHLVWIPKDHRHALTGEVQKETKRLIQECCERQGLTLVATFDGRRIISMCERSATIEPGLDRYSAQRVLIALLARTVPSPQKDMQKGASLGE